jgi:Na+-transporting NADH:ubiquinone oxidoreductase subunit NqrC
MKSLKRYKSILKIKLQRRIENNMSEASDKKYSDRSDNEYSNDSKNKDENTDPIKSEYYVSEEIIKRTDEISKTYHFEQVIDFSQNLWAILTMLEGFIALDINFPFINWLKLINRDELVWNWEHPHSPLDQKSYKKALLIKEIDRCLKLRCITNLMIDNKAEK